MCAMLAMIAPKELGIAQWRATFFLESYLGQSFLLRPDTNSSLRRAFDKAAVACPRS